MLQGAIQMFFDFSPKNILIWLVLFGGISVLYMIFMPQLMGLQSRFATRGAKQSLSKLEKWSESSKETALEKITEYGRPFQDVKSEFEDFLEFFTVEPVSEDPSGVLNRLEHLLDVRKRRYEDKVRKLAPEADEEELADLEMAVEGAASNYAVYKLVRHYIAVAEKMESMQLAQMLQMQMPLLEKMAESYHEATKAFVDRKAIGDGIGSLVASKLIGDSEVVEEVRGTVYAETEVEGRRVFVIKAKGPGGRAGKPGELTKKLSQNRDLNLILMVDAGLKLEGEESGKVVEGVGAAIGGPPTEKYKIEEIARKKDIPIDAVVVKMGLKEAITPLTGDISKAGEKTVGKIREAVRNRTSENGTIIIAGVGNTIGIGQDPDEIPTEFREKEKEEDELESFASLPGMGGFLEKLKFTFQTLLRGDEV